MALGWRNRIREGGPRKINMAEGSWATGLGVEGGKVVSGFLDLLFRAIDPGSYRRCETIPEERGRNGSVEVPSPRGKVPCDWIFLKLISNGIEGRKK